jgi:hypothetical protein
MTLKIVQVANFPLVPKGAGYFGVEWKLSRAFTRLGHNVLNFSDRAMADGAGFLRIRKLGIPAANRALRLVCREFTPDLLLFGHADLILPETVAAIREARPGIRIAQWNVDPLFEPDNVMRIQRKLPVVDVTFVSTDQPVLRQRFGTGVRTAFMPNPADPAIERHRNFERPTLDADLLLAVGNGRQARHHAGQETTPDAVAALIAGRLPSLRCIYGGIGGRPHLFGRAYEEALGSAAMGLNLSRRGDVPLYSSDRMAHLAGNGILVVTDRAAGFDTIFSEDEMAFYGTEDEMLGHLSRFAADAPARMAVAERGWAAYHRRFGADRIANYMLGVIRGETDPEGFPWRD